MPNKLPNKTVPNKLLFINCQIKLLIINCKILKGQKETAKKNYPTKYAKLILAKFNCKTHPINLVLPK